ncbi:protein STRICTOSIDINE SYNTHASE-LIKE 10-like [Oryza brachyantha]|uniref:Strictosidine synthase conserved region domain-containing protein n=1 Tax=Oryza brachyantha TaxID=4533 RepID=J3MGM0_ORYBR|nr:protein STRICTOSIDINE SYNTHASE-LIKE 10-like [Oryza brachyantha]
MDHGRRCLTVFVLLLCLYPCAVLPLRSSNTQSAFRIRLPNGVSGAESLAFDPQNQGPYTGVSDGRILKWDRSAAVWMPFAYNKDYQSIPACKTPAAPSMETESRCGRPLGLAFHRKTGDLYIADAYKGLMRVGPSGGEAEVLATEADGVAFNFVNGIDVDQSTGDVYFTDSSTTYTRRNNIDIMLNADATARLLKYDARTKQVTVLRAGLPYANGVAVSPDGSHVVVAHTWPCQAFRYWLAGPRAGQYELFADLPGYLDNVRRDGNGGYWVALNREKMQSDGTTPASLTKHLVGVRLTGDGTEVEELTAARGDTLSEVTEMGRRLWLGSVELNYVGRMDINDGSVY